MGDDLAEVDLERIEPHPQVGGAAVDLKRGGEEVRRRERGAREIDLADEAVGPAAAEIGEVDMALGRDGADLDFRPTRRGSRCRCRVGSKSM